MEYVVAFAIAIFGSLAMLELYAWNSKIARWLTRKAAKQMAESARERAEEEWLAHIEEMPNSVARLMAALGFLLVAIKFQFSLKSLNRNIWVGKHVLAPLIRVQYSIMRPKIKEYENRHHALLAFLKKAKSLSVVSKEISELEMDVSYNSKQLGIIYTKMHSIRRLYFYLCREKIAPLNNKVTICLFLASTKCAAQFAYIRIRDSVKKKLTKLMRLVPGVPRGGVNL